MWVLLLHRDGMTRRDLYTWAFRSVVLAPVVGVFPGVAWGVLAFGPVEGSYEFPIKAGALVGMAFAALAGQALGMAMVRLKTILLALVILAGTLLPLVYISLSKWGISVTGWVMTVAIIVW